MVAVSGRREAREEAAVVPEAQEGPIKLGRTATIRPRKTPLLRRKSFMPSMRRTSLKEKKISSEELPRRRERKKRRRQGVKRKIRKKNAFKKRKKRRNGKL